MPYLHHILVHFPIALGILSAASAGFALLRPTPLRGDVTRFLGYAAAVVAVAAVVTGLLSAGHLLDEGSVESVAVFRHRNVALGATVGLVATACIGWLGRRKSSARLTLYARIGALIGGLAVGGAGHFGGDMLHPGIAPWSDAPHAHGHGMMMQDDGARKEEHDAAGPQESSMAPSAVAMPQTSTPAPPTSAKLGEPSHRHASPIDTAAGSAASSAPPDRGTDAEAPPARGSTPSPMTGMPPGHQM